MAQSISQEALAATGLPGATAASRHAGATASGVPTGGSFLVGDYVIDQTGKMYVCSVAGSPGTWVQVGPSTTNAVLTAPFETVSSSATALSGSVAAALNASTASFFYYSTNPTAQYTINITNAPNTAGQSVTFALAVINGSTAYLPLNITINGTQAGASSTALPVNGATNNSITTFWQSGTAPTAGNASTLDTYTFTIICTATSNWTVLASQTKF